MEIDAPLGNKIPVKFLANGKMSGSAPHLAGYLGSPSDEGRWWVKGDELCSQWQRWLNGETQCLRLSREGGRIHWINQEGRAGTATIVSRDTPQVAAARIAPARHSAAATPAPEAKAAAAVKAAPKATVMIASAWSGGGTARPPAGAHPAAAASAGRSPAAVPPAKDAGAPASPATGPTAARPVVPRATAAGAGPLFRVARVDASDVLFVREGPSAEHVARGALMPDARDIRITGGCRSRWCPVTHREISGWVNRAFLEPDGSMPGDGGGRGAPVITAALKASPAPAAEPRERTRHDAPDAPRSCLSDDALALLDTIEEKFGPVTLVSTCRPGATIAGTGRPSRHASGNAIDFDAGNRKAAIVAWLAANHRDGGTMTYAEMDHIHADIGPHFVSLAPRDQAAVQAASARDWSDSRMSLWGPRR